VILLAGGIGGWGATVPISGALIAPGQVVVESNVKKVQHPTGGVVGEVRVRDGDLVKAGDIVVRLDETVVRANLAIVIVVAHRPVGIEGVDQLLVLKDGRMQAFGPKEQVLGQVLQRVPAPAPIKVVSEGGVKK